MAKVQAYDKAQAKQSEDKGNGLSRIINTPEVHLFHQDWKSEETVFETT